MKSVGTASRYIAKNYQTCMDRFGGCITQKALHTRKQGSQGQGKEGGGENARGWKGASWSGQRAWGAPSAAAAAYLMASGFSADCETSRDHQKSLILSWGQVKVPPSSA
jgi:hypothetical protein